MELWAHQKHAVEKAKEQKHLAIFYEAGTGKTGAMIHILRDEYNQARRVKRTLIFAPLTVCQQWKEEFLRFSKIPTEKVHILTGVGRDRVKQMERILSADPSKIIVTNYEGIQIDAFYNCLLKWNPEVAVFDESHRLKSYNSKRAKRICPLTLSCDRRFLLTGTPILNSLLDIFGQYKVLDPLIFGGNYFAFRSKFFYDKNAGKRFSFPDWRPHDFAAKQIGEALKKTSVQAKRDECLDLPPLHIVTHPTELGKGQAVSYLEMRKNFLTEVAGMVSSSEFEMVKTLRMQQILSGFVQPDEREEPIYFSENPRLDALLELISSIGAERGIIWTVFRPTYKMIGDRLTKEKITHAYLTGEQSQSQKQDAIDRFRSGEVQILIANPAAASEGINLQEARYAFYYSRGYNLLHYLQSQARNYRGGTEKLHSSVVHYQLVSKGTLDEVIAYALFHKQSMGDTVLEWAKGKEITLDTSMSGK